MLTDLFFLRESKGLTLRALADRAGVSKTTIINIENGAKIPRMNTIYNLAFALDISPEALFLKLGQGEEFSKRNNDGGDLSI